MRATKATQRAERRSQILMITGGENSSTFLAKARNAFTVRGTQTVAVVHGEEPKFIKLRCVEGTQYDIVAVSVPLSITRINLAERLTTFIFEGSKMFAKQGEPFDVP